MLVLIFRGVKLAEAFRPDCGQRNVSGPTLKRTG